MATAYRLVRRSPRRAPLTPRVPVFPTCSPTSSRTNRCYFKVHRVSNFSAGELFESERSVFAGRTCWRHPLTSGNSGPSANGASAFWRREDCRLSPRWRTSFPKRARSGPRRRSPPLRQRADLLLSQRTSSKTRAKPRCSSAGNVPLRCFRQFSRGLLRRP